MFQRFTRSWRIAVQCLRLLNEDRSLMVFPLFSFVATAALMLSFGLPIWIGMRSGATGERMLGLHSTAHVVVYFALYLVCYSVATFFNTGLIFVALKRMDGEVATVGDGLRAAASRADKILGYCLIAATVGAVLRAVEERVGFVGRLIAGVFGFAFTIATALAVPALVAHNVGPIDAIKESIAMMKRTWGENIIGNAGVSALTVVGLLVVIISTLVSVGLAAAADLGALALVLSAVGFLAFCAVLLVSATIHSIYTAALFRFASGESTGRFLTRRYSATRIACAEACDGTDDGCCIGDGSVEISRSGTEFAVARSCKFTHKEHHHAHCRGELSGHPDHPAVRRPA